MSTENIAFGVFATFGNPNGFVQIIKLKEKIITLDTYDLRGDGVIMKVNEEVYAIKKGKIKNDRNDGVEQNCISFLKYSYAREKESSREGSCIGASVVCINEVPNMGELKEVLDNLHKNLVENPHNIKDGVIEVKHSDDFKYENPEVKFQKPKRKIVDLEIDFWTKNKNIACYISPTPENMDKILSELLGVYDGIYIGSAKATMESIANKKKIEVKEGKGVDELIDKVQKEKEEEYNKQKDNLNNKLKKIERIVEVYSSLSGQWNKSIKVTYLKELRNALDIIYKEHKNQEEIKVNENKTKYENAQKKISEIVQKEKEEYNKQKDNLNNKLKKIERIVEVYSFLSGKGNKSIKVTYLEDLRNALDTIYKEHKNQEEINVNENKTKYENAQKEICEKIKPFEESELLPRRQQDRIIKEVEEVINKLNTDNAVAEKKQTYHSSSPKMGINNKNLKFSYNHSRNNNIDYDHSRNNNDDDHYSDKGKSYTILGIAIVVLIGVVMYYFLDLNPFKNNEQESEVPSEQPQPNNRSIERKITSIGTKNNEKEQNEQSQLDEDKSGKDVLFLDNSKRDTLVKKQFAGKSDYDIDYIVERIKADRPGDIQCFKFKDEEYKKVLKENNKDIIKDDKINNKDIKNIKIPICKKK